MQDLSNAEILKIKKKNDLSLLQKQNLKFFKCHTFFYLDAFVYYIHAASRISPVY